MRLLVVMGIAFVSLTAADSAARAADADDKEQVIAKAVLVEAQARSLYEQAQARMADGRTGDAIRLADEAFDKLNRMMRELGQAGVNPGHNAIVLEVFRLTREVSTARAQYRKQKTVADDPTNQRNVEGDAQPPKPPADGSRADIPSEEARQKALAEVKDVFKERYAQKDRATQLALARELSVVGRKTKDDPVTRYVLFCQARDLALACGEILEALKQVDWLAAYYKVPRIREKGEVLNRFGKQAEDPKQLAAVAEGFGRLSREALEGDDYRMGAAALKAATHYAEEAGDKDLLAHLAEREADVQKQRVHYEKTVAPALETLKATPKNAKAHDTVGRYFAFIKNDWQKGLTHLKHSADETLRGLAAKDLAGPGQGKAMADLADGWWDLAEDTAAGPAKKSFRQRAVHWYEKALPKLSGFAASKARKRLEAAGAKVSSQASEAADAKPKESSGPKQRVEFKFRWRGGMEPDKLTSDWDLSTKAKVMGQVGVSSGDRFEGFSITTKYAVANFALDLEGVNRANKDRVRVSLGSQVVWSGSFKRPGYWSRTDALRSRKWELEIRREGDRLRVKWLGKTTKVQAPAEPAKLTVEAGRTSNWVDEEQPALKKIGLAGIKLE